MANSTSPSLNLQLYASGTDLQMRNLERWGGEGVDLRRSSPWFQKSPPYLRYRCTPHHGLNSLKLKAEDFADEYQARADEFLWRCQSLQEILIATFG
jgi:hypothetical protein